MEQEFYRGSDLEQMVFSYKINGIFIDVSWMRVMDMNGEWQIGRHKHSSYELHLVRDGSSKVILDDCSFIVEAGEGYLMAPHCHHQQEGIYQTGYKEYCLCWTMVPCGDLKGEAGPLLSRLRSVSGVCFDDMEGCIDYYHKALRLAKKKPFDYKKQIESLIYMIIMSVLNNCEQESTDDDADTDHPKKLYDQRIRWIEQYIEDNIDRPIRSSELSQFIHLSEKQISRIIKANRGVTTKRLIELKRHEWALELLENSSLSVKEVAFQLGYVNEYHFNRTFKNMEGCPPGYYRRNCVNVQKRQD